LTHLPDEPKTIVEKKDTRERARFGSQTKGTTMSIDAAQKIFVEVLAERDRQDSEWGGEQHDDGHTPDDWRDIVGSQLARSVKRLKFDDTFRQQMIRTAATAIAAVEAHDRRHPPIDSHLTEAVREGIADGLRALRRSDVERLEGGE
jgi:hypothetical protein